MGRCQIRSNAFSPRRGASHRAPAASVRSEGVFLAADRRHGANAIERLHLEHAKNPNVHQPAYRPLRVYAYDPSLGVTPSSKGREIAGAA
jgi:hypothetical protein